MVVPPEGHTWELPAGTWDLHVLLGKEVIFSPQGDSYVRGFHDERVTIEAGRTTDVKVVAAPAGQIALRIDPPEARARRVRVETAGRELELTALDFDSRELNAAAGHGTPVLHLTRQALAPGTYTLTVRVDGYAPATVRVEVLVDQLVDAKVELQPR